MATLKNTTVEAIRSLLEGQVIIVVDLGPNDVFDSMHGPCECKHVTGEGDEISIHTTDIVHTGTVRMARKKSADRQDDDGMVRLEVDSVGVKKRLIYVVDPVSVLPPLMTRLAKAMRDWPAMAEPLRR